jgi:TM2 domain-containing membrane protein YozV
MAENERATVIILCCLGFVGLAGIHRFYKGKILSGLLWLFTGGLCGIGTILDLAFYANKGKFWFDK